jgi:hypothetical protein
MKTMNFPAMALLGLHSLPWHGACALLAASLQLSLTAETGHVSQEKHGMTW